MKHYIKIRKIISCILTLLFISSIAMVSFSAESRTKVESFEIFNDICLSANSMGEYSTIENAENSLFEKYPCVKVNGSTDTIDIQSWTLQNNCEQFDNKEVGTYIFSAFLEYSTKYFTSDNSFPTIKIVIQSPKISITKYESLENIHIKTNDTRGYSNIDEAQESLLKKYNSVQVNGSEDIIQISKWSLSEAQEYNPLKAGFYTFQAVLSNSDKYIIDETTIPLTLKVIVEEPEKTKTVIKSFEYLQPITSETTSAQEKVTENEVIQNLCGLYKSIKVNGEEGTVPIIGWSLYKNSVQFNSSKAGSYTFIAELGTSDKYETENIAIPLPTIQMILSVPKFNISILVIDQNNTAIGDANIKIYNSEYTHSEKTDSSGLCAISNVAVGSYNAILSINGITCHKTITVKSGFSSVITWTVNYDPKVTSATTKTSITTKPKETSAETEQTVSEKSINNIISTEELIKQISDSMDEPIEIMNTQTSTGLQLEIAIDQLTEEQKSNLEIMSTADVCSEVQKAVDAVSTVNFIKTTDEARKKIANVTEGLNASVLPINFTLHANFAFPVQVSVCVGKGVYPSGENYYLYYYNKDNGMVESYGNASVNENGVLTFTISHCSDYFLMDKEITSNLEVAAVTSSTAIKSENETVINRQIQQVSNTSESKKEATVSSSDTTAQSPTKITIKEEKRKALGWKVIVGVFALIIFCLLADRRKKRHKID